MSDSLQWMKFYPRDWRGDQGLRAVSLAARGLWIEMIAIMHEAVPYGHLKLGRSSIDMPTLAHMVNTPVEEVEGLLAELKRASVFTRTSRGVIFSRRMVKDARLRATGKKFAQKRWGSSERLGEKSEKKGEKVSSHAAVQATEKPTQSQLPIGSPNSQESRVQSPEIDSSLRSESIDANSGEFAFTPEPEPIGSGRQKIQTPNAIRQALESVVSGASAKAIIEHRRSIKHPLTLRAAEILAGHLAKAPEICGLSPDAAADTMIDHGWRGFDPEWVLNAQTRDENRARAPPRAAAADPPSVGDELREIARQERARGN